MEIHPDEKSPTASGNTLKSGYGIQEIVTAGVSTNQSHAVTEAQNAITYFPEFDYQSYWRVLERMGRGFLIRMDFHLSSWSGTVEMMMTMDIGAITAGGNLIMTVTMPD